MAKATPYEGFKITTLRAFVSVDPKDGEEGIIAKQTLSGWMPMVCADDARFEGLKPVVAAMARETGMEVLVKTFTLVDTESFP